MKHSIKLLYHIICQMFTDNCANLRLCHIFVSHADFKWSCPLFFSFISFGIVSVCWFYIFFFIFLIKWWILVDFELSFYIVIICSLFSFNKSWCELFSLICSLSCYCCCCCCWYKKKIIFGGWMEDFWWLQISMDLARSEREIYNSFV